MKHKYLRSFLSVFLWLFGLALPASATTALVWPDAPGGRLYRLTLPQGTLEEEASPGQWRALGPVQLVGVEERDFPPLPYVRSVALGRGSARYLLVNCTQQVYRFDFATRTLTRLDRTFYRGYNCHGYPFLRRDSLYSFGGYGFWHTQGILSQYLPEKGEWEALSPSTDGPPSISHGSNAYLPAQDAFFSTLNYTQSEARTGGTPRVDPGVFRFSFRTRVWEKLGEVRTDLRERFPLVLNREVGAWWTGQYFVYAFYEGTRYQFLLIDPERNQVRLWEDRGQQLAGVLFNTDAEPYRRFAWGDLLLFHRIPTSTQGASLRRIQLSARTLWQQGQELGAFYEPVGMGMAIVWGGLAGIGLLVIGGVWMVRRRKTSLPTKLVPSGPAEVGFQQLEPLSEKERAVLEALLLAYPSSLSADALNQVLGTNKNTVETQRRNRSDAIKALNKAAARAWRIGELVVSVPTKLDGRMFNYALSSEAYARLIPSQKTV